MIISSNIVDLGSVHFILTDVYRPEDALHGLAYQRRVGLRRLSLVLRDQLGLDDEEAFEAAAGLIGGFGEA